MPLPQSPPPDEGFDAFLSYSRTDIQFATWLEARLESFRPPKGLGRGRRLRVFRDAHDLVGSTLSESIEGALEQSSHLLVVCSPGARASAWVDREVETFAALHGAHRITPVLLEGVPDGEGPADGADRAFPAALGTLLEDALAADFRAVAGEPRSARRSRRREALLFVLARLLGVEKEELARRQRARTVRSLGALSVVLAMAAAAFAWISMEALDQRDLARNQTRIATSRRLAAQTLMVLESQPDLALLLAAEACAVDPNGEAQGSLLAALERHPNLLGRLRGHASSIRALAFDPSGERLVSLDAGGSLRLWDVARRRELAATQVEGEPLVLHLPESGERLVVGGRSGLEVRRVADLGLERSPTIELPGDVRDLAVDPAGRRLATLHRTGIALWDLEEGRQLGEHLPANRTSLAPTFSPDGALLALGSYSEERIRLWEVETGRELPPLKGVVAARLAFAADGRRLASAARQITLWDLETGEPQGRPLVGHGLDVTSMAFDAQGSHLASVGRDGTLRFWSLEQGRELVPASMGFGTSTLVRSPDGRFLATGGEDGVIELWTADRWDLRLQHRLARRLEHATRVDSVCFSPDGSRLLTTSEDGLVSQWEVEPSPAREPGAPLLEFEIGGHDITRQVFGPGGELVASAHRGFVSLWDRSTGETRARLDCGEGMDHTMALAFGPDGKWLAAAGMDRTIRLWDCVTHEPIGAPLLGHEGSVLDLAVTPDGEHLVSAGGDGTVRLWRTGTWEQVGVLRTGEDQPVLAVHVPDASRLLAVSSNAIHEWGLPRLRLTRRLPLDLPARAAAFVPDGEQLALLRADNRIQLWDLEAGQPLSRLLPQNEATSAEVSSWGLLSFSSDGRYLASGNGHGTARLWEVELARWTEVAHELAGRELEPPERERYLEPPAGR